jgi:aminoglycoside 3-N-acetyltransferase
MISKAELVNQLAVLGIEPGGVLLVHTAFSKVKPIEDGPPGLITALEAQLGPQGTLVMPSMSYDDEHIFDPKTTPCREEVGVVADSFWRLPHVLRSDNAHAFAASGSQAAFITKPHPLDVPHGLDSPVGRVYELDGQVLLLGVGHDSNTTMHLAENLAGVRYRMPVRLRIHKDGQPEWFEYAEVNHCCHNFRTMDGWLDEHGLQRKGQVGHAQARLIRSRAVVEVALQHLKLDETCFLHPPGVDDECDQARASLKT